MPSRNIAVFIDGTWNTPLLPGTTNVRKLFESCVHASGSSTSQITYYLSGVGADLARSESGDPVGVSGTADFRKWRPRRFFALPRLRRAVRRAFGGAGGWGTEARIREAYAFLCDQFRRGDRIFLFGFSRGAFAARSLAGFISRVGILLHTHLDKVDEAWALYEADIDGAQSRLAAFVFKLTEQRLIEGEGDERSIPIHFLGVWDTVGALGLPRRAARFTAPFTEHHQVVVPPNVMAARQAMALHELRPDFKLMLWSNASGHPDLKQVWFPGDHADVGGGHDLNESGYADNALRWMAGEAVGKGLHVRPQPWLAPRPRRSVLHQQSVWFLFSTPEPRSQLHMLDELRFGPWDHAARFDDSVAEHLKKMALDRYGYWRPGIDEALRQVDQIAQTLYMLSRLRNLNP